MTKERYAKLEVWRSDVDHQFYARVRAPNGKILLSSEAYKRRRDAEHCCDLVRAMLIAAQVVAPAGDLEPEI